jgi:hypothetical protein
MSSSVLTSRMWVRVLPGALWPRTERRGRAGLVLDPRLSRILPRACGRTEIRAQVVSLRCESPVGRSGGLCVKALAPFVDGGIVYLVVSGDVAERLNAPALKAGGPTRSAGSNPAVSSIFRGSSNGKTAVFGTENAGFESSPPSHALVAQLVEQLSCKQQVDGSNPSEGSIQERSDDGLPGDQGG